LKSGSEVNEGQGKYFLSTGRLWFPMSVLQ